MSGDPGTGLARLRGVTLATLITLLTALGHEAGGGSLPDLALVVVLLPMLAGVLVAAARRCGSLVGVTLTLAAGQFVLHQLLVALHPAHQVVAGAVPTLGMVAVHVLATGITAVLVRGADRAVVTMAAGLRRLVPRRPVLPPVAVPLLAMAVTGPAVPLRLARARTGPLVRRGPPDGR